MGKFNELIRVSAFERDLKQLRKRFRTLEDDLQQFVDTQLVLYHKLNLDNGGIFRIPVYTQYPPIHKAKKFACRALKGTGSNSGIRVIYAYEEFQDRITLLEIYYKGDKPKEDWERIAAFLADKHEEG